MPRRLLERCRPDCIREFREAAQERFNDGLSLAAAGRRTAAIYLWGYVAEMTLKAAYFSLVKHSETDPITWGHDIRPAIVYGRTLSIAWPSSGEGHNIHAWAQLLVAKRASIPNKAFSPPLARALQRQSQRFEPLWRETLRYRKNFAYLHELTQIREAAQWLLIHSPVL